MYRTKTRTLTFKETEKFQNRAARIMCFKSKVEPVTPCYRDLKIL